MLRLHSALPVYQISVLTNHCRFIFLYFVLQVTQYSSIKNLHMKKTMPHNELKTY